MNKFLLAVSMLVASLSAQAQTNVTVYGQADVSFESATSTGAANGVNRGTFNRVSSNGSYIGFKGSEALGSGLKAVFQIESGIDLDNNTGMVGGRDTFVGLSSADLGTVILGTLTGPTRTAGLMADSRLGHAGISAGSSIFGKPEGGQGTGTFDTRFSNAIAYVSPTFGGLTMSGAYTTGENKSASGVPAAQVINTSGYDLGATYVYGPVTTALTHAELKNRLDTGAPGTNLDSAKITRLVSVYSFEGGHKVSGLVERTKNAYNGLAPADLERNSWGIGGKYHLTAIDAVVAQYFESNNPSGSFYANNSNRRASLVEAGYEHYLSKRTVLKASYSVLSNQENANYDFSSNSVGAGLTGAGSDYKVLAAGIRHSF